MPLQQFYGNLGSARIQPVVGAGSRSFTGKFAYTAATAFTTGAIAEIFPSTAYDSTGIWIYFTTTQALSSTRESTLVEFYLGVSGSEQLTIGPISIGGFCVGSYIWLPIFIPAGSRLSFAARGAITGRGVGARVILAGSTNSDTVGLPQAWITYGLVDDSSNAQGTSLPIGATDGSYGNWVTLTSSTTYAHDLWLPMIDRGSVTSTPTGGGYGNLQISFGGSSGGATEYTNNTLPNVCFYDSSDGYTLSANPSNGSITQIPWAFGASPYSPILWAPKPAGSTIDVRLYTGWVGGSAPSANSFGASVLAAI